MARVFVSHASQDLSVAVEVRDCLRTEGHQVFLDRDLAEGMRPGDAWKQRLYAELRVADVVVCVVSAAFVTSTWCTAEVAIADSLGCHLVPVKIDDTPVHPLMEGLHYADYQADQQQALDEVVRTVREVDTHGSRWREGQNPFPGLTAFTAEFAPVFFGRERETRQLVAQMRSTAAAEQDWTVIIGPSGSGKSSLLRAGVLPAMDADRGWLVLPPMSPGKDPVAALARVLATVGIRAGRSSWSLDTVRDKLAPGAGDDGLRRLIDDLLTTSPATCHRVLLAIDQTEELFTRAKAADADRFARLVAAATAGPVRVAATLRSEFLDDLRGLPGLTKVGIDSYLLAPMRREMLRLSIEKPARHAGLTLSPDLVGRLLDDTVDGDALPLLAFTLHQLAAGRSRGDTISDTDYERIGEVKGALGRQADAALAAARTASELDDQQILARLVGLATLDTAGRYGRHRLSFDLAADPAWAAAVAEFVNRGLLTADTGEDGRRRVAVTHEAFFTAWDPLAAALREHADRLRTQRSVEQAAAEWRQAGGAVSFLWDARRLAASRLALGTGAEDVEGLSVDGRAFLDANRRHVALARTRRRRFVAAFAALSVAVVAVFTEWQFSAAQEEKRDAITRELLALAGGSLLESDPRLAIQLALAANDLSGGDEALESLHKIVVGTEFRGSLHHGDEALRAVAFSPDGTKLAFGGDSGDVVLAAYPASGREREISMDDTDTVNAVAFAPDSRVLAAAGDDGKIYLWDTADIGNPRRSDTLGGGGAAAVNAVAFAPDSRVLAAAGDDGKIYLWDTADIGNPRRSDTLGGGGAAAVNAVAFAPDGHTLAAAGDDGKIYLWDTADRGRQPRTLDGHAHAVTAVAFHHHPDGDRLATADAEGSVMVWDVAGGGRLNELPPPPNEYQGPVTGLAYTADGRLVTAGEEQAVLVRDADDPAVVLGSPISDQGSPALDVALTPDGKTVAIANQNGSVLLWSLDPQGSLGAPIRGVPAFDMAFTDEASILFAASKDDSIRIWNVVDPANPQRVGAPIPLDDFGEVLEVAVANDSRIASGHTSVCADIGSAGECLLAISGSSGQVKMFDMADVSNPEHLGTFSAHQGIPVNDMEFSDDGRLLATGAEDGNIRLWDVSKPSRPSPVGSPLAGHTDAVRDVEFDEAGRGILATAGDDTTVRLWDLSDPEKPRPLGVLEEPRGSVNDLIFHNGQTLFAASDDGYVWAWDVGAAEQPTLLGRPLADHRGPVYDLALLKSDGPSAAGPDTLATAGEDHRVSFWDIADPRQPRQLGPVITAHSGAILDLTVSGDTQRMATASEDQTIRIWDIPALIRLPDDIVELACVRTNGGLTEDDWKAYVPDLPYRSTC